MKHRLYGFHDPTIQIVKYDLSYTKVNTVQTRGSIFHAHHIALIILYVLSATFLDWESFQ